MAFEEWLIEHLLEIILVLISSTAVYFLIQINKNQLASIKSSPGSSIIQVQEMKNSQINTFKEKSKKETEVFGEAPVERENPKELLSKIRDFLDQKASISIITEMSLRLSQKLKMKKDEEWLSKEVYGFREYIDKKQDQKGMKLKKLEKNSPHKYRSIKAELNMKFGQRSPDKFPVNLFISQSLNQIEDWINPNKTQGQVPLSDLMVMQAPPMQLMVEDLKVDPKEKVPYIINRSSLQNILLEVRLRIIKFLEEAEKKIK